ncbi:hypothetical protein C0989_003067 [Termitomyces sp. Mn162]|nr:hypothetical protein C0989_003067 [Termitomyces sp. Mn162]
MERSGRGPVPSPVVSEMLWQQWAEALSQLLVSHEEVQRIMEDCDGIQWKHDEAWRGQDLAQEELEGATQMIVEGLLEVWGLWKWLVQSEAWAEQRAEVEQGAVEAERARAESHLDWVQQHCILLLDGASAAYASMQDGLAQMPRELPSELEQGFCQMGQLLVRHWQRSAADPGAWWKVATDVGEPLPRQPEVLAIVVTQMEVDLVGGVVWRILEEERE